jgi:hypothetical protein
MPVFFFQAGVYPGSIFFFQHLCLVKLIHQINNSLDLLDQILSFWIETERCHESRQFRRGRRRWCSGGCVRDCRRESGCWGWRWCERGCGSKCCRGRWNSGCWRWWGAIILQPAIRLPIRNNTNSLTNIGCDMSASLLSNRPGSYWGSPLN